MKTKFNILILTLISIIIVSCSENDITEQNEEVNTVFELLSTESLDNPVLFGKTIDLITDSKNAKLDDIEFDLDNITISKYKDSEINSIVIPQVMTKGDDVTYSLVTYSYEDKLLNDYLIVKIEDLGNNLFNTQYIDSNEQLLGEITVQDNIVISAKTYGTKGAKGKWNDCVKRAIDRMSSGTTAGNIEALACFAFGPSCAAGTAIGCLGVALFT